jgi:hypothetical protein
MTETSDPEGTADGDKAEEAHEAIDPQAFALTLPLQPIELSPAVTQLLNGANPMKLMAARGISPLRPPDLAVALYQLTFDPEEGIQNAARGAPVALPDTLLLPMCKEPLPPAVLHFIGTRLAEHRGPAIEAVLYNPRTPDQTFVVLARKLWGELLEVICQNESRLLRCPAIVKSLFGNPAARMSSVNRAIELCARNKVEVDIPAYHEIAKSILDDPEATSGADDQAFESVAKLAAEDTLPPEVEAELLEEIATEEKEGAIESPVKKPEEEKKKKSAVIDFTRLKLSQKIRLATFGNEYCRFNLIRDGNRLVAMAAARSPKIGDKEIVAAAASKAVHADVVRYISTRREFLRIYAVRMGLVTNPKCPPQESMRLVGTLMINDIKKLAKSRNVPNTIQVTAKRIIEKRGQS